jgi:aminobenzoyl-glutamate transport protein
MKTDPRQLPWRRLYSGLCVFLIVSEAVLVPFSWLLSVTMQDGVRSLLSAEGVRWFLGSFTTLLASPRLVWLLLLSMVAGSVWRSGLAAPSLCSHTGGFLRRVALMASVLTLVLYEVLVLGLTAVPHAVLLSATGRLFPSPFSRALVPLFTFGMLLIAVVYGWASGRFTSLSDVARSWSWGISQASPFFVLYLLSVQFLVSLRFVFA